VLTVFICPVAARSLTSSYVNAAIERTLGSAVVTLPRSFYLLKVKGHLTSLRLCRRYMLESVDCWPMAKLF
jgi:hypothetical protein